MFEAMMLRIHGQHRNDSSEVLKKRFRALIQATGYEHTHYAGNFGHDVRQKARTSEQTIDRLLRLLNADPLPE
jgi:hypothetical protein